MSAKKKVFEVNDRVFAKVRGFPAWPARIMELANASATRYKVFFYGTYETATLKKDEIWDYNASSIAKFGKGNQKRKGFAEGMYEIENMPDLQTAEALEEEASGPSEAMDTSVTDTISTPPPKSTSTKSMEKTPVATTKEKTPVVKEKTQSVKEKTPIVKEKEKTTSVVKEKTQPLKEKTPIVKEKTPIVKEKTPVIKEKGSRDKTPVHPKEKNSVTPKEKTTSSSKKDEVVEEKEVEVVPEKKPSVEPKKKVVPPQPEPEPEPESEVKEEEEADNEVVTSSVVVPKNDEPTVKSTPADTTTTEDEPMKEEPDDNVLVINETTPVARTRNNRSNKRKADELTPSVPPPAKKKNAPPPSNVTPSTNDNHSPCATVSRSGRIIKPKKFVDDEDDKPSLVETTHETQINSSNNSSANNNATEPVTSTQNSNSSSTTIPNNNNNNKTTNSAKKEPRKMWVEVKSTGDMIEINLDQDKPSHFESKEAELQWEKTTARNALKFKERVESGDFIPDEVRVKLEEKVNRTEEEDKILKKARQNSLKMEKIRWLKIEQKIIDLDIDIKGYCNSTKPDLESCLKSLNEFDSMTLAPLMLKKQPTIVNSLCKLRRYVGPKESERSYDVEAEKIRNKAEKIYSKLKSVFEVPEGSNFDDFFRDELAEFRSAIKSMDKEKLLTLVSDPTKKAKKKK
ncbi:uncharacterized protein [Lepeophtheirus salmonis]|uniref:uncharacterized protein n=1 Tax=Lepeophtheirus salmonis TaxID=72036 RepID=UPI001AE6790F|nr:hepatoma-derived growth factor-related protein 2-like [Lepeophtheirus salmonis]